MLTRPPSLLAVGACLWIAAGLAGCGHGAAGAATGSTPRVPSAPALEGAWTGTLHLPGGELRLVVKIRRQGSGWTATVDSIDQHARDIPIDTVAFDGAALTLRSSRLNASFEARLVGDSSLGDVSAARAGVAAGPREDLEPAHREAEAAAADPAPAL